MMSESYVYLLIDPRDKTPFYVGKGVGQRCHFHVQEARYYADRRSPKLNKIRKILALGLMPEVIKIKENISDKQAIEFECFLIAKMRNLGVLLTNLTDGGDGAKGYKHTEQHKQQMRKMFFGRALTDEQRQKLRKPKSADGRMAIAAARRASSYRPSEETKRKTSQKLKGRTSPMKGRTHSEEAKARMSAMGKGRPKAKTECPHCKKFVAINTATRWHFENCKELSCQ